jgi:hypothetical protein
VALSTTLLSRQPGPAFIGRHQARLQEVAERLPAPPAAGHVGLVGDEEVSPQVSVYGEADGHPIPALIYGRDRL